MESVLHASTSQHGLVASTRRHAGFVIWNTERTGVLELKGELEIYVG